MRSQSLLIKAAISLLGVACAHEPTAPLPVCEPPVTVQVSAGRTPTFTWTPACRLGLVQVEVGGIREQDRVVVWDIDDTANLISPPLTYGHVPRGAHEVLAPQPLERGDWCDLQLAIWNRPDPPYDPYYSGLTEFRWYVSARHSVQPQQMALEAALVTEASSRKTRPA
jgi:hypothetical protein